MKKHKNRKLKKLVVLAKFALLILIILGIPLYVWFFQREWILEFQSYDDIINYLKASKGWSIVVYIGAQIVQIVISILPGQMFQIAAGSIFGFLLGLLISVVGAGLGTSCAYYLAKVLGRDAVYLLLGQKRTARLIRHLNTERAYIICFLLYLIPGMPKDTVCYAAGLSRMRLSTLLFISTVGRIPGMCGSLLFGKMWIEGNHDGMIVVGVVVALILLICFYFRKPLHRQMDRLYEKLK